MHRRTTIVTIAALALGAGAARADDVRRDEHVRDVSPEASSGVNPNTTRGMNRGMGSPTSTIDGARLQDPMTPAAPYGPGTLERAATTRTTAATVGEPAIEPSQGEDQPAPERRTGPHGGLFITGTALAIGSYAASAFAGVASGTPADQHLLVPVAGPWLDLARRDCGIGDCGGREDVNIVAIASAGVAQAAGLALAVASFFVDRPERPRRAASTRVEVVPLSLGAGGGVGAVGVF